MLGLHSALDGLIWLYSGVSVIRSVLELAGALLVVVLLLFLLDSQAEATGATWQSEVQLCTVVCLHVRASCSCHSTAVRVNSVSFCRSPAAFQYNLFEFLVLGNHHHHGKTYCHSIGFELCCKDKAFLAVTLVHTTFVKIKSKYTKCKCTNPGKTTTKK